MKKIFLMLILLLVLPISIAQQEGKGVSQQIDTSIKEPSQAQNTDELQEMIQTREQEMNQEMLQTSEKNQEMLRNQNRVRLAVHALLAMENLTGGIGRNVSAIAREFNNSVQSTIRAEEKIQERSGFARFFAGGDKETGEELNQLIIQNKERIQQLTQLREQCECSEEVKNMFQEQIQNMEQEQTRLQELSQKEIKSKGLFGWLWK